MSATLAYEPHKLPAGILALAVHGAFFSLLYFGFSWQTLQPAAMHVDLWQSLPEDVAAPPVEPKVEAKVEKVEPPPPPPPPPQKAAEPDIALPSKKKPVPVKPAPVEKVKSKRVETKRVETKPVETRPVETKSSTEIADEEVAREQSGIAEQAAREQADQAARIRADKDAATNRVVDEYKARIMAKIRRNVVMPPGVANDARAEFSVTLLPGGAVLPPRLRKSSGNAAYDNAVERAILKSDPLPLPPDAALFNRFRELDMVFKPTE